MAVIDLDERVAALETDILRLQAEVNTLHGELRLERQKVQSLDLQVSILRSEATSEGSRKKDWRRVLGLFADDPGFAEASKMGKEYRERQQVLVDE